MANVRLNFFLVKNITMGFSKMAMMVENIRGTMMSFPTYIRNKKATNPNVMTLSFKYRGD